MTELSPENLPRQSHKTVFHELMRVKVREVLLVASPYDAFIIEEDGNIASRIINEYKGLNLSKPPHIVRVSSGKEVLELLKQKQFDLVITTPFISDMDASCLGVEIKKAYPSQQLFLLTAGVQQALYSPGNLRERGIDNLYYWHGNTDLFLALIKNYEDHCNVAHDTAQAQVRVLLVIEDNPFFKSLLLPILYKIIVQQTQTILEEGLNEEQRLLKMRARPKILTAASYEEALHLYTLYQPYILGVLSDTNFYKNEELDSTAGLQLLKEIRKEAHDLPLMLLSSNSLNCTKAEDVPAVFLDKNHHTIYQELEDFFLHHLGFGPFIFRLSNQKEIARADNLYEFEKALDTIPDASLSFHACRNHFSTWVMARTEVELAGTLRTLRSSDFNSPNALRHYLCQSVHHLRQQRQKGVIAAFNAKEYEPDVLDFVKMGGGSIGGKGRGLAFMNLLLSENQHIFTKYAPISIRIPHLCVIAEEIFNHFIEKNKLYYVSGGTDAVISRHFLAAQLPASLRHDLRAFLDKVHFPLAIRSSSVLEDSVFRPYAGMYNTYMVANQHSDLDTRLAELERAIKLVFASSFFEGPRSYSQSIGRQGSEAMAVIIQELSGRRYTTTSYYPTLSGVAQSYNYYPVGRLRREDGLAHLAIGFGKTVVDGEQSLQFSPRHPTIIPQFSNVEETLRTAQRSFYSLTLSNEETDGASGPYTLTKRAISEAENEFPVRLLTSTYIPEEHRIRDGYRPGPKVPTFASLLKYKRWPLCSIINDFLSIGSKGMGCDVEIEFSAVIDEDGSSGEFHFLQIRPMVTEQGIQDVSIGADERKRALLSSDMAFGISMQREISHLVCVDEEAFANGRTDSIAKEIGMVNAMLSHKKAEYLLLGPGRWGSADRHLGIPVQWQDIAHVRAIVETPARERRIEPSLGSHFFQNITSLGIPYLTIQEDSAGAYIDWKKIRAFPVMQKKTAVTVYQCDPPLLLRLNGKKSEAILLQKT